MNTTDLNISSQNILNTTTPSNPSLNNILSTEYKELCYEIVNRHFNFYCLSFQNPERSKSMKERFENIGLELNIFEGVPITDKRIADNEIRHTSDAVKRLWSVTYGHLTNIRNFYYSNKEFGVFCENDVLVNKNLPFFLPDIMSEFKTMNLDLLLLGYMCTFKLEEWMQGYSLKHEFKDRPYKYLNYPNHQWGIHGLMLDKKGARLILETFWNRANEYIGHESNFSPDWTITKVGNRALITPMFIVENGEDNMEHYKDVTQHQFHLNTWKFNHIPDVFI
jgi:hypothetical protein